MEKIKVLISPLGTHRMRSSVIHTVRDPLDHSYLLLAGKFVLAPGTAAHPLIADNSKFTK